MLLLGLLVADAIYVSPSGNDSFGGERGHPVATIQRAIELARSESVRRIVVGQGEYELTASVHLDERDSGLTIEAAQGARPRITGAVIVPSSAIRISRDADLQRRAVALDSNAVGYSIDFGSFSARKLAPYGPYGFSRPIVPSLSELFADDRPMTLARWPNEGFTQIKSVREPGNGEDEQDKPKRRPIFTGITDRAKTWKNIDDAWLFGYWKYDWADETIKIHSIDPETGEITLDTPHVYGVKAGANFFVENLPEELDAAGEYYPNPKTQTIEFVAKRSQRATYRVSMLGDALISLNGAKNVVIRGLDFAFSRGDGVRMDGCRSTRLEGCRLYDLGERAGVVEGGADSGFEGCDVWNTGEGGFRLAGGDRKSLTPGGLFVDNCDIHHYMRRSQTYRPAVSLEGVGNRVSHCSIHDAPHSAILYAGNNHLIEANEFYRTISRTGDGGVVYTGRDWTARGTVIEDNYFHDNIGLSQWENAIYFDDLASGLTARRNLIVRCNWGFLIGGGRDNVIEDNQIIDCKLGLQCDARGLGWAAKSKPTMMDRLMAMPYQSAAWTAAYPSLAAILSDENPMRPFGNVIARNVLVRSGALKKQTEAPFDKTCAWDGNVVTDVTPRRPPYKGRPGLIRDSIRRGLPSSPGEP